uniref:Uncharacterized protein n=1 Tax=Arundo donax TaxID=35708 RepID=A0A0A8Z1H1_ARUDO
MLSCSEMAKGIFFIKLYVQHISSNTNKLQNIGVFSPSRYGGRRRCRELLASEGPSLQISIERRCPPSPLLFSWDRTNQTTERLDSPGLSALLVALSCIHRHGAASAEAAHVHPAGWPAAVEAANPIRQ